MAQRHGCTGPASYALNLCEFKRALLVNTELDALVRSARFFTRVSERRLGPATVLSVPLTPLCMRKTHRAHAYSEADRKRRESLFSPPGWKSHSLLCPIASNSACNFHIVKRGSDDTGHLFIEDALRGWIWSSTTQGRGCACLPVTQRPVCQTNTPEARSSPKHQFSSCATRVSQRTDFEEPSPKLGALRLGDTNLHSSFRLRSIGKIFIVTDSRFSS